MEHRPSRIAVVTGGRSVAVQPLFARLAAEWLAEGAKIAGVIAEPHGPLDRTCTAGVLRNISSRKSFQIHLETPPAGTSCDIDAAGVASACAAVLENLATSDLVVLSKFGKLETIRAGLAEAFETAIAAGKPILTTVSERHLDALLALAPQLALLPADEAVIRAWWRDIRSV